MQKNSEEEKKDGEALLPLNKSPMIPVAEHLKRNGRKSKGLVCLEAEYINNYY